MTLGEKIREVRRKCGFSQVQLAEKMSVSRSAIAKWETDKGLPDVGTLKILARLLNVSVDYLLDETEEPENPVLREIPVYCLECRPDQEAVQLLHDTLFNEDIL
jgi:transcriptional regulator with XRE-family HTH domain